MKKGQSFYADESKDVLLQAHRLDLYVILQSSNDKPLKLLTSPNCQHSPLKTLSRKPYSPTPNLSKFDDAL